MRALLASSLILASALGLCVAANGVGVIAGVQTYFSDRAELSEEQIRTMLRLASKHGLDKPVSVSTRYSLPILDDWNYYVVVRGPETVAGRKVSYVEVFIEHRELKLEETLPNPFGEPHAISVHDFRVDQVLTNDLTTFVVSATNKTTTSTTNQTIRVRLQSDVPLSAADRIVAGLQTGKIRPVEGLVEEFNGLAVDRNVRMLSEIKRPAGKLGVVEIGFGSFWLECSERQEEFVVTSIGQRSH